MPMPWLLRDPVSLLFLTVALRFLFLFWRLHRGWYGWMQASLRRWAISSSGGVWRWQSGRGRRVSAMRFFTCILKRISVLYIVSLQWMCVCAYLFVQTTLYAYAYVLYESLMSGCARARARVYIYIYIYICAYLLQSYSFCRHSFACMKRKHTHFSTCSRTQTRILSVTKQAHTHPFTRGPRLSHCNER